VTGLIVGAEYNTQTSLPGIQGMVMGHVQPIVMDYAMFVNPIATNGMKTAQPHSWWYGEIAWIDPAQKNSSMCLHISGK